MLTKQEMFDRAWNGLKSQNWQRCTFADGSGCAYENEVDGKVMHCAWGWVDPEGTSRAAHGGNQIGGGINGLHYRGIGLAAELHDEKDRRFASQLQSCHDRGDRDDSVLQYSTTVDGETIVAKGTMQEKLRAFAAYYGLKVPDDAA